MANVISRHNGNKKTLVFWVCLGRGLLNGPQGLDKMLKKWYTLILNLSLDERTTLFNKIQNNPLPHKDQFSLSVRQTGS